MKLNNKAFTLIELVVIIALLGIIAIIVTPMILNGGDNAKKALLNQKIENIESAAVTYGQDNREKFTKTCNSDGEPCKDITSNCYCYNGTIKVKDLITAKVLNPDQDSDDIINPLTKESLKEEEIILYQKYGKIYAYIDNEELYPNKNNGTGSNTSDDDNSETETTTTTTTSTIAKTKLSEKILENAKSGSGTQTVYSANPKTTPLTQVSGATERTLSEQADKDGMSYYFRGNVEDNYLEFNNMCWRIVRIQGDGSIKLTLAAEKTCSSITDADTKSALIHKRATDGYIYGYTYSMSVGSPDEMYTSGDIYNALNDWFTLKNFNDVEKYLKKDIWCLGGKADSYLGNSYYEDYSNYVLNGNFAAGNRYNSAKISLLCQNENTNSSYIGTLSMDEVALAGGSKSQNNTTYYLYDNTHMNYWTLTVHSIDNGVAHAIKIDNTGKISITNAKNWYEETRNSIRPAITLDNNVYYASGNGIKSNPYRIKL